MLLFKDEIKNAKNITVITDVWVENYTIKIFLGKTIYFLKDSTFLSDNNCCKLLV